MLQIPSIYVVKVQNSSSVPRELSKTLLRWLLNIFTPASYNPRENRLVWGDEFQINILRSQIISQL